MLTRWQVNSPAMRLILAIGDYPAIVRVNIPPGQHARPDYRYTAGRISRTQEGSSAVGYPGGGYVDYARRQLAPGHCPECRQARRACRASPGAVAVSVSPGDSGPEAMGPVSGRPACRAVARRIIS